MSSDDANRKEGLNFAKSCNRTVTRESTGPRRNALRIRTRLVETDRKTRSSRFPEVTADPFGGGTTVARGPPVTPSSAGVSAPKTHRAYPRSPRATDSVR
ncbi:hypothetical protein TNCV_2319721 [Trichonephila clavipes]|nr:hypothetical protein TNCV_2319721 [Trichonephila clavipes]